MNLINNISLEQKAMLLTTIGIAASRIFFYCTQIFLMYIFAPSEFGVVAVLLASIAFANGISAMGVDAAIISNQKVTGSFLTAAWIVDFIRGIFLTIIFVLFGPYFGTYILPESQLGNLLPVIGLSFIILSCRNIGIVCLRKELKFEKLMLMDISVIFMNCLTTVVLAIIYESIWAVVIGHLVGSLTSSILSYIFHDFRFYKFSPKGNFLQVISFSKWIVVGAQINSLIEHGIIFLTAGILGSSKVAYLDRSDMFTRKTSLQFAEVLWKAGLPIFSRNLAILSDLREKYLHLLFLLSTASFTVMTISYLIFSNHTVNIFGSEWANLSEIIPLFALVGWLSTIYSINSIYFQSAGIPKIGVKYSMIRLLLIGISFYPLVMLFNVMGVVMALLIGVSLTLLLTFEDVRKRIDATRVIIIWQLFMSTIPGISMIVLYPAISSDFWIKDLSILTIISLLAASTMYSKIKLSLKL